MAEQGGAEAITLVIEKLTEIVECGHTDVKLNTEPVAQDARLDKTMTVDGIVPVTDGCDIETVEEQTFVIVQEETDDHIIANSMKEYGSQQDPCKENEIHTHQDIVLNLPPGIHNLSSADPQALLQALMQMSSGQVVLNESDMMQTGGDASPQNAVPLVENIGAEMVNPESNVYTGTTVTVYGRPGSQRIVQLLPAKGHQQTDMPAVIHVPSKKKQIGTKIVKNPSLTQSDVALAKNVLLKCAKCDYCSHNKHYLKQHVDLVHNADRPFKCPFCDYAGKRSHSLKEHLVVHSTNRPFECPICNASFRKKGHLTNHIRLHNTFKYFECSICQEKFKDRAELYSHLRTAHEPSQVYECKVCEYATTIKSNIVMHMHTHGNPEIYRCNICSFTALHINILRQHMQTHSANNANLYNVETQSLKARPVILLKCSVCGYTTDNKDALQNHMWQHLPEEASREFNCPTARDSESECSGSTENLKGKDQTSIYKCTECNYLCKEAYLFITHMLAHHPRQKLIADQQKQQQQKLLQQKQQESYKEEAKDSVMAFTHDSAAGMYRCTICGYMCEQQRTIKAHIWKHSGHKDIDYPMFQNGPISVYDDTPVGKAVLLSEKSKKPPIKVIPRPKEDEPNTDGANDEPENQAAKGVPNSTTLLPILSGCQENKKIALPLAEAGGMVKISPHLKKISDRMTLPGPRILHPLLPNQPIRWTVQQLKGVTQVVPVGVPVQASPPIAPCVRLIAPLSAPGGGVPVPTATSISPANCSPEIVRLILGAAQQQKENQCDLNSGLKVNTNKRKISIEHTEDKDAMVGVAKRLCLDEKIIGKSSGTGNVVVQQVSQIYTTPNITIGTSHICSQQPPIDIAQTATVLLPLATELADADTAPEVEITNDDELMETESTLVEPSETNLSGENKDLDVEKADPLMITEVVVETRTDEVSSHDVEEISVDDTKNDITALVKLLKKGPNHNPVCPSTTIDVGGNSEPYTNTVGTDTDPSDADSETAVSEENKCKKGICSSLLAVIEQLRERSKSESEGDGKSDGNIEGRLLHKVEKKTGSKRKSRAAFLEDDTPIEQYVNVEKINANPAQYRCKLCHYSSNITNGIKNHMRLHKTKQPFECSLCDYQADSSESLQEHMLQHCKVRTYHCKVCTAVFNYKSQLRAHMRAHNEKEPFLCDLCDYETANPIAFRNHSRVHIDKKDDNSALSEVSLSEKSTSMDSGTETQKDLGCDECDYEAENSSDLMVHIRNQHPVSYKCDQCEQQCSTWSSFSAHLKMHLEVRTLKCELCDFVATSMRSLKSHMKRHVNDQRFVQQPLEQYKCNLCGYVCHHLPSLKSHMWRHASDKNYSYQITNDVINAAIDYDTNPAIPTGLTMATDVTLGTSQTEVSPKAATDALRAHDIMPLISPASAAATSVVQSVTSPKMVTRVQSSVPAVKTVTTPCLVTFRCCQCGFESLDKSVLNDHMKIHLDIIRKTLEVNKSRLVARAMKEMGRIEHASDNCDIPHEKTADSEPESDPLEDVNREDLAI